MENLHLIEYMNEACLKGDSNTIFNLLLKNPYLINQANCKLGWTPLYRTVICGHLEAAKLLLEHGADPNTTDSTNKTILYQAIDLSHPKLVKLLLTKKADPNILSKENDSCLHLACLKEEEKIVKLLLDFQANPNIQNSQTGKIPLHYAVESSNRKIIKLLLENNANPHIKDFSNKSSLDLASNEIKSLISRISKPKNEDSEKSTKNSPLFFPSPENVEAIPSIPIESFATLNLSPVSASSLKNFDTFEKQSFVVTTSLEPDSEKQHIERVSKAFSFGGNGAMLMSWLESVKLEFLYEVLMEGGYDDIEQNISQMMTMMPINEEMLEGIGIDKPGYRKRLLGALDEDTKPLKSLRKKHRQRESTSLGCCIVEGQGNFGMMAAPDLKHWLGSLNMPDYFDLFEKAGYGDLEHLLALMNSKWPITEKELVYDIGIVKKAHVNKILAALRSDSCLFESFKKSSMRGKKEDLLIDRTSKSQACDSCVLM
ncbi:hypothetical protein SteCoe_20667 [Stentor coeruleus]|uniref:SAM domain-containing protein n=1 Tax=Stentor coeruleus TaxID=5963 RepID=A0A1R2BRG2_9CILI|nr:hypothetical protein SteCoe_20667 [Stentor coeruleus]